MYTEMERERVIDYLQEITRGANEIIIVDPYFLKKLDRVKIEDYLNDMDKVLGNTRRILLITNGKRGKYERHERDIKRFFSEKRIEFNIFKTGNLHDRLWIKDKRDHYIVGSSFNGVGFSFGFIYRLERKEIKEKIKYYLLEKINRSRMLEEVKNKMSSYF